MRKCIYCGALYSRKGRLTLCCSNTCSFWAKVVKTDGCWEFNGTISRNGYGRFYIDGTGHGKRVQAHRYSWELHNGPIPAGLRVCHKCDNPKCIRPDHLFLGTDKDNAQDKINKGRSPRQNRLTHTDEEYVRQHYRPWSKEFGSKALAKRFNVTTVTIWNILKRSA